MPLLARNFGVAAIERSCQPAVGLAHDRKSTVTTSSGLPNGSIRQVKITVRGARSSRSPYFDEGQDDKDHRNGATYRSETSRASIVPPTVFRRGRGGEKRPIVGVKNPAGLGWIPPLAERIAGHIGIGWAACAA